MESVILEVNLKNISNNYNILKRKNPDGITASVVKANAYGLGINKVSKVLIKSGCKNFFVATLNEAIELRKIDNKINIYTLNGLDKNEIKFFIKFNIIPTINSIYEFKIIQKLNKNILICLHYDTGMNRLGMNFEEMLIIQKKFISSKIKLKYIISHLASAEKLHNKYNNIQLQKFKKIKSIFKNTKLSLCNSSGIFLGSNYLFDMTRPGISIYGGYGNNRSRSMIKDVIKLKAKIIQIKKINKNETIGYNQTYRAKKSKYIATIAIGYADGIPRIISSKGSVYFKKYKSKILGNISMDSTLIDITKFYKKVKIGDYIEIINKKNDIEVIAMLAKTVSQEILTSFGKRVKIHYIK